MNAQKPVTQQREEMFRKAGRQAEAVKTEMPEVQMEDIRA